MLGAVSPIPGAGIITGPGLKTNKPNRKGRASPQRHPFPNARLPALVLCRGLARAFGHWNMENWHVSNGHPSLLWLGSDPSGKWGRVKVLKSSGGQLKTKNDARLYFSLKSGSSEFTTSKSHPSITSIILTSENHWNNGPPCHRPPLGASPFLCPCPCSCPSSRETCPEESPSQVALGQSQNVLKASQPGASCVKVGIS